MPLQHSASQEAFETNLKAEMQAGKPQAQALAIAYSIRRRAGGEPEVAKAAGKVYQIGDKGAMTEHLRTLQALVTRGTEVAKSHRTIYLDMDGPLADYDAGAKAQGLDPAKAKDTPGFFRDLPEKPGARAAVADLLNRQIRVVVLSAPPESRPDEAVAEKRAWLKEHFPALEQGAQFTRDKGEVGEEGDILVDDHPEWANAMQFPGRVVRFRSAKDWECVHDLAIQETGSLDAFIEAHGLKAEGVVAKSEHDLGDPPHHSPTDPQKHAGNYKMAHWKILGMDITIENLAGSTRSGVNEAGEPWEVVLPYHYGYVKKTVGADGDHLDIAIGPLMDHCDEAHIINQNNPFTGEFDEHKVFIGFPTREAAIAAFRQGRSDDPDKVLAGVVTVPIAELKRWIAEGCLEDEAILKAEHTAHVKAHYRTVDGKVTYIPGYDKTVHGEHPEATLHQRTVYGAHKEGTHMLRATDAEDREAIKAAAAKAGVEIHHIKRSGANHHGRQNAYDHIHFHTEADAKKVHDLLATEGELDAKLSEPTKEPEKPAAPNPPPVTIIKPEPAAPTSTSSQAGHMPTPAEMIGMGGKEWEKNGKHRIYFDKKNCPKLLDFPGGNAKVWFDFKDGMLHSDADEHNQVKVHLTFADIKKQANGWGATHTQSMPDPKPHADTGPEAGSIQQDLDQLDGLDDAVNNYSKGITQATKIHGYLPGGGASSYKAITDMLQKKAALLSKHGKHADAAAVHVAVHHWEELAKTAQKRADYIEADLPAIVAQANEAHNPQLFKLAAVISMERAKAEEVKATDAAKAKLWWTNAASFATLAQQK